MNAASIIQEGSHMGSVLSRCARIHRLAMSCVVVACTAALTAPAAGAAPAPSPVQQALDTWVADGVPGAIALVRSDGSARHFASGVSDLKTARPIRPSDRFRIGSISKAYTSTVVLQMVAARRLSLEDSVEHWLPGLVPNGRAITVRELMNHTSGIPEYLDIPFFVRLLTDPLHFYTPRELVALAVAKPPTSPPGAAFSYSNTDYILLGLIVAAVDHVATVPGLEIAAAPLEIGRRVIAPLGLRDTSFPIVDPDIRGPHSHGYEIDLPPEIGPPVLDATRTSPSWAWTAGAIISTLDDVADFHRALFGGRLLRPAQQHQLETTVPAIPGALDYGLGVFKLQTPCGPAWGHDGSVPGYLTISLTSPDESRQAVVMANRDANTFTEQLFTDGNEVLISAFCGESVATPTARRMATVLPALLGLSGPAGGG
jgi:D-alanyl-D-alanine carboxypeptidase